MNRENRLLVADEPVEVQDFRKIVDYFRRFCKVYSNLIKKNWKMSTCNLLDLLTLGYRPITSKNLSGYKGVVYTMDHEVV